MATVPVSSSIAGQNSELTEGENFGIWLRRAREEKALSIGDLSAATKVSRSSLEVLERGDLGKLPAEVFVRGFIRSYAKTVGVRENEPLSMYDRALKARVEAKRAQSARPVVDPTIAGIATDDDHDREGTQRRGLGLAVFVIILLLIATITLSLLLRRPPPSGEGLSLLDAPAESGRAPAGS